MANTLCREHRSVLSVKMVRESLESNKKELVVTVKVDKVRKPSLFFQEDFIRSLYKLPEL